MSEPRCYTRRKALEVLQMAPSTFTRLKAQGKLSCVVELEPRLGRRARYRADLIDLYVAGQWGRPRSFASHRRISA